MNQNYTEKTNVTESELFTYGTDGLYYRITDRENKLCSLAGIEDDYAPFTAVINVPSYAKIGNEKYRVCEIGEKAFYANTAIVSVKMNDALIKIGASAFEGCTNLTTLTLSGSMTLGKHMFDGCTKLQSVTIPHGIVTLPEGLFYDCNALTYVELPRSVCVIGATTFSWQGALRTVYYNGTEEGWGNIDIAPDVKDLFNGKLVCAG